MQITIAAEGKTVDVTQLVPAVSWSGDWKQAARTLSFSVVAKPGDKSIPTVALELGANVKLREGGQTLFDGFLVSRGKNAERSTIEVTCFDRGWYLRRNRGAFKFRELLPEEIAVQLAGEYGIAVGTLAKTGCKISRNFIGATLYDVLQTCYTLASAQTGKQYHLGFEAEKLCVRVIERGDKTLVLRGQSNLIGAAMTDSIENLVSEVGIYDENDKLLRVERDATRVKQYGVLREYLKQKKGVDTAADVKKLLEEGEVSQQITVDCLGNIANVTGGAVVVQEPVTGLFGLFYIQSDTHEWKGGQYYNKLTLCYKNEMNKVEAGSAPK